MIIGGTVPPLAEEPEELEELVALAVRRAAEVAAYLLVNKLAEIPPQYRPDQLTAALKEIMAADRVIIAIEASEKVQGLRLAITPARDGETLQ